MVDITIKEVIISIVIIWFQISLANIGSRLSVIDANVTTQMVNVGKLEAVIESQMHDMDYLRSKLNTVDKKLSKHIEESPKTAN